MSTDDQLAEIYKQQQEYFDKDVKPLLEQLTKDTNSTAMVDDAEANRKRMAKITPEMQNRNQSRFMGSMSAAQQYGIGRANDTNQATAGTAMVNNARSGQQQRNTALRGDLSGAYNSLMQGSTAGLSTIANNEAARKAQADANNTSFMSSALGAVGTVVGGIYGGPAGASIGGAAGSAIGGYF